MAHLILPERIETRSVRQGRAVLLQIMGSVRELQDRGKHPVQVQISTALVDKLRAFFDYAYEFDGTLPQQVHGVPIVYVPGAGRSVHIECDSRVH